MSVPNLFFYCKCFNFVVYCLQFLHFVTKWLKLSLLKFYGRHHVSLYCIHLHHERWFVHRVMVFLFYFVSRRCDFFMSYSVVFRNAADTYLTDVPGSCFQCLMESVSFIYFYFFCSCYFVFFSCFFVVWNLFSLSILYPLDILFLFSLESWFSWLPFVSVR